MTTPHVDLQLIFKGKIGVERYGLHIYVTTRRSAPSRRVVSILRYAPCPDQQGDCIHMGVPTAKALADFDFLNSPVEVIKRVPTTNIDVITRQVRYCLQIL